MPGFTDRAFSLLISSLPMGLKLSARILPDLWTRSSLSSGRRGSAHVYPLSWRSFS